VHCNIIIHYRPMKCTFTKIIILIFSFDVSSMFQTQWFIFRKMVVYMQLWYSIFCMHQCKQSSTRR